MKQRGLRVRNGRIEINGIVDGVRLFATIDDATPENIANAWANRLALLRERSRRGWSIEYPPGVTLARYLEVYRNAKKRGGDSFALPREAYQQIVERANGRCELTGIPFSVVRRAHEFRAPFAPSLDRIDSGKPYSAQNCRLVCVVVNLAINQFGEDLLRYVAASLTRRLAESVDEVCTRPANRA